MKDWGASSKHRRISREQGRLQDRAAHTLVAGLLSTWLQKVCCRNTISIPGYIHRAPSSDFLTWATPSALSCKPTSTSTVRFPSRVLALRLRSCDFASRRVASSEAGSHPMGVVELLHLSIHNRGFSPWLRRKVDRPSDLRH